MSYFHITILSYLYTFDEVLGHFALEPNERWSSDIVDLLGGSFIGFLIICLSRAALVLIKSKKRMKLIFFWKTNRTFIFFVKIWLMAASYFLMNYRLLLFCDETSVSVVGASPQVYLG